MKMKEKNKELSQGTKVLKNFLIFPFDRNKKISRALAAKCPLCGHVDRLENFLEWEDPETKISLSDYHIFTNGLSQHDYISISCKSTIDSSGLKTNVKRCPGCSKDITEYRQFAISTHYNTHPDLVFTGYSIIKNEDRDTLSVILFFNEYFLPKENEAVIYKRHNMRLVFNVRTGQTWIMEMRNSDGKKQRSECWPINSRLLNITFAGIAAHAFFNPMFWFIHRTFKNEQLFNDVADNLAEMIGISRDKIPGFNGTFNTNSNNRYDINMFRLVSFNYFKNYNLDFYETADILIDRLVPEGKSFLYSQSSWKYIKKETRFTKRYMKRIRFEESEAVYRYAVKTFHMPDKKQLKKLFFVDPLIAFRINALVNAGFTDYNIILSIARNSNLSKIILSSFENRSMTSPNSKLITSFISRLIKEKGDLNVKKMLCGENFSLAILEDTAQMHAMISDAKKKEGKQIDSSMYVGSLQEIHDKMSSALKYVKTKKADIPYQEGMKDIEADIGSIKFVLAKDTHQLIDVGEKMNICVGSYGKAALEGRCIIVLMVKEDQYKGCIELQKKSANEYTMIQAKAKWNKLMSGAEADALKKWAEENAINTRRCYDYRRIYEDFDYGDYPPPWIEDPLAF